MAQPKQSKKSKKSQTSLQFPEESVWIREMHSNVTFHPNTLRPDDVQLFQAGSHGRRYIVPKFASGPFSKNIRVAFKHALPFLQSATSAPIRRKKELPAGEENKENEDRNGHLEPETYVNQATLNLGDMITNGGEEAEIEARYFLKLVRAIEQRVYDECLSANARMRILNPKERTDVSETKFWLSVDGTKLWQVYEDILEAENPDSQCVCIEFKAITIRDREDGQVLDKAYLHTTARLVFPHKDIPFGDKKSQASLFADDVPTLPKAVPARKRAKNGDDDAGSTGSTTATLGKRTREDIEAEGVDIPLTQDPAGWEPPADEPNGGDANGDDDFRTPPNGVGRLVKKAGRV